MLFDKVIAYDNYRQKIVLMINIETENLEEKLRKSCTGTRKNGRADPLRKTGRDESRPPEIRVPPALR